MVEQCIERKITWGDIDSLGIVFYPRYYEWIDQCSHLLFDKIYLNLVELWENRKLQFGLLKSGCAYFAPGRYHQDIIIKTHIEQLESKTITTRHTIADKNKKKVMVSGMEKRICIHEEKPDTLRACEIPEDIRKIFQQHLYG